MNRMLSVLAVGLLCGCGASAKEEAKPVDPRTDYRNTLEYQTVCADIESKERLLKVYQAMLSKSDLSEEMAKKYTDDSYRAMGELNNLKIKKERIELGKD